MKKSEIIGKGFYGVVYKGEWNHIKNVAVKEIHKQYLDIIVSDEDFEKHIRDLTILSHPNLVKLYNSYHDSEIYGFVMEYAEGGSLRNLLSVEEDIPWSRRRKIAMDVISGLEYLHSKSIVHGDLKSSNIFLEKGNAKLSDFGVSLVSRGIIVTEWIAPEIISDSSRVSIKSDIFSLGAIIWELASGQIPLVDHTLPHDCPKDFETIIKYAMVEAPAGRPNTSVYRMILESATQDDSVIEFIDFKEIHKVKLIGKGAHGNVHQALWNGRIVAIKELIHVEAQPKETLQKEIEMMLKLDHINILELFGFYAQPEFGLVMEFMEGGSLWNYLHKSGEISWSQRREIAIDISNGLGYLHSLGVVHRDIKSPNVLLTYNFRAKLADFGIAKLKSTLHTVTINSEGDMKGTLRWMAPEVMSGLTSGNKKSDIYSLGIVLWELASRRIPFEQTIEHALCFVITQGLSEVVPEDCPEIFGSIITACIQRNAVERPEAYIVKNSLRMWHTYKGLERSSEGTLADEPDARDPEEREEGDEESTKAAEETPLLTNTSSISPIRSETAAAAAAAAANTMLPPPTRGANSTTRDILLAQWKVLLVLGIWYHRQDLVDIVLPYSHYLVALLVLVGVVSALSLMENDAIIDPKGLVKMSMWKPIPREEQLKRAENLRQGLVFIREVIEKGDFLEALRLSARGVVTHDLFPYEGTNADGTRCKVPYISNWNLWVDEKTYGIVRDTATWSYQLALLMIQLTITAVKNKNHFDGLDEMSLKELQSLTPRYLNALPEVDKIIEFFTLHPEVKLRVDEWKERVLSTYVDFRINGIDSNVKKFNEAQESCTKSSFMEMLIRGFLHLIFRLWKMLRQKYSKVVYPATSVG